MKYIKHGEEKIRKREQQAIYTAAQLFLKRGIETVKMTDIAEESGIGVASLYRYFGTKERVVIRVGELLWSDLRKLFEEVFTDEAFLRADGFRKIKAMVGVYRTLYRDHKDFIAFIGEFDRFCIMQGVPKEDLESYEKSIGDYYPMFVLACQEGEMDGSVRKGVDYEMFYKTLNHAAMALLQKLLRGEILSGDDFSEFSELDMMLDAALYYLKGDLQDTQ